MKHLGITHKRGDDSYEYESRCMLGQLEARMKTTGQKFGSWVRTLEDGTVIVATIIMNGVSPIYRVNVVAAEEDTSQSVSDAFMESGWTRVITSTEADFESAIYPTDTQSTMQGGYPTWLDWIGEVGGSIENTRRAYVSGMTSLAMVFDKVIVSPTPQFLVCAVNGKLQMMAQAQYGTQLGVGTVSLEDYLAGGGSVTTGP